MYPPDDDKGERGELVNPHAVRGSSTHPDKFHLLVDGGCMLLTQEPRVFRERVSYEINGILSGVRPTPYNAGTIAMFYADQVPHEVG